MRAVSATDLAPFMTADAPAPQQATVTATETNSTPSAHVEGPALPIPMAMACATTQKSMDAQTHLHATTVLRPPTMTDHASRLTFLECAEEPAQPMPTETASLTNLGEGGFGGI